MNGSDASSGSAGSKSQVPAVVPCTAFSAVAPSAAARVDAHQSKLFGSGISIMPPGPNTRTLNIQPLDQFRPHRGFLVSPIHIAQQCGPLTTYRRDQAARKGAVGSGQVRQILNVSVSARATASIRELNVLPRRAAASCNG